MGCLARKQQKNNSKSNGIVTTRDDMISHTELLTNIALLVGIQWVQRQSGESEVATPFSTSTPQLRFGNRAKGGQEAPT
jgi:hypothetical protein